MTSRFTPYCVGYKVWLDTKNLNTTHLIAKLAPKCHGPFIITAIWHTSYWLKLPFTWKVHNVFHASLLIPYKETAINGRKYQEPIPDLIDGQPEWEVECILGTWKRCQQLQSLVRWKGFSDTHDSWEPLANINTNCIRDSIKGTLWPSTPSYIKNPLPPPFPPSPFNISLCLLLLSHSQLICLPSLPTLYPTHKPLLIGGMDSGPPYALITSWMHLLQQETMTPFQTHPTLTIHTHTSPSYHL